MPATGASHITMVEPCCLHVDGGSLPAASALLFARTIAFISALVVGFGFGLADMDGMVILPPACEPEPLSPAQGWPGPDGDTATFPGASGPTGSPPRGWLATLLQENLSAGAPDWLLGGDPVCGPRVMVPKARDESVPDPEMPRAMRAASTNSRQLW